MIAKYDPSTGASLLGLQERICKVTRGKSMNDVPSTIERFEADYRKFQGKVGRTLDALCRTCC